VQKRLLSYSPSNTAKWVKFMELYLFITEENNVLIVLLITKQMCKKRESNMHMRVCVWFVVVLCKANGNYNWCVC